MRLKHLLSVFLTLLTLSVGQMWGADVTFTPGTDTGETSVTKSGVTCTMTTMNNASYYQIYANQSGTFSVSTGNITKIEFTCTASGTSKYGPGNTSANVGSYSYSGNKGTWTGEATSVTLSSTAQVRMTSLTVSYEAVNPASITLNPEGGTCAQSSLTETSAGSGVTLPSASPSSSCTGQNWIFAGWAKTAITETTTEPTLYTGIYTPVDGETLHAVYKKTESSGGSSAGSQTFTFSSIASANSWSNGVAYTPVVLSLVSLAGNGGGNNAKYYTSDKSWRMYSGGTVNISVEGGSVTSVSSTPSKTFTVSNGEASLSCTETIKFTEITVNYTVTGASVTTYNSNPSCCTQLGSINGSFFEPTLFSYLTC